MNQKIVQTLRDQIRGVTGALVVLGLTFHYTMETWWLGWTLPFEHLFGYTVIGLACIVVLTRYVGFKTKEETTVIFSLRDITVEFTDIVVQGFIASYTTLLLLGIIEIGDSLSLIVRLGLIEMIPLGFGAALANKLFTEASNVSNAEGQFPRNIGVFAVGAIFITGSIAPTQEMELISAHMDWSRHLLLGLVSLSIVYLLLYELAFQGQTARSKDKWLFEIGTTFIAYAIALIVSAFLLAAFGHFRDATLAVMVQGTIVLAFPASVGAAAAEVVI